MVNGVEGVLCIDTERLHIRRVCADDWRAVQAIWADFSRSPYACYDRLNDLSDETMRRRIARWASFSVSTEHMFFAVCLQDTVIGYIALNIREEGYEVGYSFHSAYHAKGYATESLSAVLREVHDRGLANRFTAGTALANTPSVRLLERVGFRRTGTEQVSFYTDAQGAPVYFTGGVYELFFPENA